MRFIHPRRFLRGLRARCILDAVLMRLRKTMREGKRIRVVFYTNEPQKWSYESLYRAFESSPHFEPLVVVVPRYAVHIGKDHTRMPLEEQYAFYKVRGYHVEYGYEEGRYLDIKTFEPDVFFYLQLAEVPGIDDPEIVSKYALTCYCPYSFSLTDYRTPDIFGHFYGDIACPMEFYDMYGMLFEDLRIIDQLRFRCR